MINNLEFKPKVGKITQSSFNEKRLKNYQHINTISKTNSKEDFDRIISYKNRKGDEEFTRI